MNPFILLIIILILVGYFAEITILIWIGIALLGVLMIGIVLALAFTGLFALFVVQAVADAEKSKVDLDKK